MEIAKEKKNVIWNIIGATANAFNSLLFAIVVTRINGINQAGIFTYSFATACLLYMVGVYAGRTFQVTDITNKNSDTDYIFHRIITCIIMMITSMFFVLIKRYDIYKSVIFVSLCGYKCIEAFSEALYGVIQKNGFLYKVGISMFLKAFISFIVFLIIDYFTKNLIIACISTIIVNILFILVYDLKNLKTLKVIKTKYSNDAIIRLFKIGFFTFILTFLANYLINAPRYAIDDILTNDLQTIFGIIIMPATVMTLLGQYIIQPSLTKLSESIKNKEFLSLKKIILSLISIIFILGILVIIVAFFLEMPVLEIIYGIDLKLYFVSMMIIIIGSVLYSLSSILSAILIAMRKTREQAIMYFITAVIATLFSYKLVGTYKITGASITYFITMLIITILFLIYIIYSLKKYKKEWEK